MAIFKTIEAAEKYGEKWCFSPRIESFESKHGTKYYSVTDKVDEER